MHTETFKVGIELFREKTMQLFVPKETTIQRRFKLVQKKGVPTRMSSQRWLTLELYRQDVEPS